MIFYQASAISEKRLTSANYGAARWETVFVAILTQILTTAVLVAVAALQIGCNRPIARQYRPDRSSSDAAAGRNHWAQSLVFQRWRGRGGDGRALHRLFARLRLGPGWIMLDCVTRPSARPATAWAFYPSIPRGCSARRHWFCSCRISFGCRSACKFSTRCCCRSSYRYLVIIAATNLPPSVRIAGWRLHKLTIGLVGGVVQRGGNARRRGRGAVAMMDFGFDPTIVFSSLLGRRLKARPYRSHQATGAEPEMASQQISDAACRQGLPRAPFDYRRRS